LFIWQNEAKMLNDFRWRRRLAPGSVKMVL
jgi:hypothetical protein